MAYDTRLNILDWVCHTKRTKQDRNHRRTKQPTKPQSNTSQTTTNQTSKQPTGQPANNQPTNQPMADGLLPTATYQLLFTYCLLSIAYCLLPLAYCLWPSRLPLACCLCGAMASKPATDAPCSRVLEACVQKMIQRQQKATGAR